MEKNKIEEENKENPVKNVKQNQPNQLWTKKQKIQ